MALRRGFWVPLEPPAVQGEPWNFHDCEGITQNRSVFHLVSHPVRGQEVEDDFEPWTYPEVLFEETPGRTTNACIEAEGEATEQEREEALKWLSQDHDEIAEIPSECRDSPDLDLALPKLSKICSELLFQIWDLLMILFVLYVFWVLFASVFFTND